MKLSRFNETKSDTIVIFIHGLKSSSSSCWKYKKSYWPDFLKSDLGKDINIYLFDYKTGVFSGNYGISDAADSLREELYLIDVLKKKHIIFVCHSLGGIVARRFLVESSSDLTKAEITVGLFLVASPSIGSRFANIFSLITGFLKQTQAKALRFSENNKWLNDLDKDFLKLKERQEFIILGKELVEDKAPANLFFLGKIVQPFSGGRYFTDPYRVPGSSHSSISKPRSKEAIQHRMLCQFIKKVIEFKAQKDSNLADQYIKLLEITDKEICDMYSVGIKHSCSSYSSHPFTDGTIGDFFGPDGSRSFISPPDCYESHERDLGRFLKALKKMMMTLEESKQMCESNPLYMNYYQKHQRAFEQVPAIENFIQKVKKYPSDR